MKPGRMVLPRTSMRSASEGIVPGSDIVAILRILSPLTTSTARSTGAAPVPSTRRAPTKTRTDGGVCAVSITAAAAAIRTNERRATRYVRMARIVHLLDAFAAAWTGGVDHLDMQGRRRLVRLVSVLHTTAHFDLAIDVARDEVSITGKSEAAHFSRRILCVAQAFILRAPVRLVGRRLLVVLMMSCGAGLAPQD